jgi:peptidyl-prolyl cis-trans isomerase SurA
MRNVLFTLWVTISLLGSFGLSEAIVDRIVAVVNEEIIMLSEVEKGVAASGEEIHAGNRLERGEKVRQVRQKVLNQLIEEKLIDIEIKKSGMKMTGKELDAAVEDIKRRNNVTQEEFENYLEKDGLTFETFKKQLEKRLLRSKFIQWSVKVDVTPGEKDLGEFYQKNIDRYRTMESYRPAHILFRVPKGATPDGVQGARKKCAMVLEKIKAGGEFGEMALLYSEDPSAKDRGDLGFFKRGELLPAIEREALRLNVGEVSGIVKTDYGFHIIKLLDRKGGAPLSFEDVKERVQSDFYEYQLEKAFKQLISSLREKSVIEVRL